MFPTSAGKIASNGPYSQVRTTRQQEHSLLLARTRLTRRRLKLLNHDFAFSRGFDLDQVKDIYKIPGLTSHDIEMFKKYEDTFTVNPPGRSFYERINARVST